MKKFIYTIMAAVGAVISVMSGASLLVTGRQVFGYDPVYIGLVGIALLSVGLIGRQE